MVRRLLSLAGDAELRRRCAQTAVDRIPVLRDGKCHDASSGLSHGACRRRSWAGALEPLVGARRRCVA